MPTRQAERELAERGDLRSLLDALPILVSWVGRDLRYRIANKAYEDWFQLDRSRILGAPMSEVVGADAVAVLQPWIDRALAGETVRFERTVPYRTGERNIDATYLPTRDEAGGVSGFIVLVEDVTARTTSQKEAKQSRELLAAVLANVADGITAVDAAGRIVFANAASAAAVGAKSPEDMMKAPAPIASRFEMIDETGALLPLERLPNRLALAEGEPREALIGWRPKDGGEQRWNHVRAVPVKDAEGRVQLVVSVSRDMTELRRRQAADKLLSEASTLLSQSLEVETTVQQIANLAVPSLADWVIVDVVDRPGEAPRRIGMMHTDPAKLEWAREADRRWPPIWVPDAPAGVPAVLRTGKPEMIQDVPWERLEKAARDADHREVLRKLGLKSYMCVPLMGHSGHVLGALTLLSTEGGRRYDAADLADATELGRRAGIALDNARLFRETQLANEQKDDFIAMLAHELRNPMAPMFNAVHLMAMPNVPAKSAERAREVIERQLRHLSRLVDDLLDVSRISRGKIELRRERFDACELVREVAHDREESFRGAGIELTLECEPGAFVNADRTRIAQVLGNLLSNAQKFTPKGGRVTVKVAPSAAEKRAWITVADTGIGIDRARLADVFDAFVQEQSSLDRSRGGLGLGLAVVKGLAILHGGGVSADSAGPGTGAAFKLWLPLEESEAAAAKEAPAKTGFRSRRVLVIDDNIDLAETIADLLSVEGHVVETETSGANAVERIRRMKPEIVLCDIGLPGKDGYAIASEVRADPSLKGVKMVAVSGYGMAADKARAKEAGFAEHLTKPVEPERLYALLAEL